MRIEHIGEATLYLGDCREVLPTLGKVDAVVTDPPFVGLAGGVSLKSATAVGRDDQTSVTLGDAWGAELSWMRQAWDVCERGFLVFCTYHAVDLVKQAIPDAKPVGLCMWHKRNAPHPARNVPRASAELIWLFQKAPGLNWRAIDASVIDVPKLSTGCMASPERLLIPGTGKAAHPAQKPVAVMDWLLGIGAESVLDPFMGTGTTGVAALKRGARFVGIERNQGFFDLACRRFEQALSPSQRGLFEGEAA